MAWHEAHSALFGAKISPEMAQAWTAAWAASGFTDQVLTDAVLGMVRLPVGDRPNWPSEHIDAIERGAGQILLDRAAAGRLGAKELTLALRLASEDVARKGAIAKKRCVGIYEWDPVRGNSEAKEFLLAKEILDKVRRAVQAHLLPGGQGGESAPGLPGSILAGIGSMDRAKLENITGGTR